MLLAYSCFLPTESFAKEKVDQKEVTDSKAIIVTDKDEGAPLLEEDNSESESLSFVLDGTTVNIIEEGENFSLIAYENEENQLIEGYMNHSYLEAHENDSGKSEDETNIEEESSKEDADQDVKRPLSISSAKTLKGIALKSKTSVYESNSKDANVLKTYAEGSILLYEKHDKSWYKAIVFIDGKAKEGFIHHKDVENADKPKESIRGIAITAPTAVYKSASTNASKWKTYKASSSLMYETFSENWYKATVIIKGKGKTGYIHKDDVEKKVSDQETIRGIAQKANTPVYGQTSTSSKRLKTYEAGTVLKYKTLSKNWNKATVYIKGKKVTGYIHNDDVEATFSKQDDKRGISLEKTYVYDKASPNANILKSYQKGSILYYKTLTNNWHEVTVYVNGKKKTGYIKATAMESLFDKQKDLRGIGLKKSTPIYENAATNSKKIKSYKQGSILSYKTLSENWYEATVFVSGKRATGYIYHEDVENAVEKQKNLKGVTFNEKGTNVYSRATTSSKKLKSYPYSSILQYKSFTTDWYEAVVFIDGERKNAYIQKSDVKSMNYQLNGFAQKNPTHIYSKASRQSKTIKTYDRGSEMKYRPYSKHWNTVTVRINGEYQKGYLAAKDIHFEMKDLIYKTTYTYDFKAMADRQAKKKPNQDGGGTIKSTRGEIEFFTNPNNFPAASDEYFQFLVLSTPAGLDAKQINERVLKGKGSLEGTAQAFINAGKKYSINEAYLIAHALHETGNGKSTLAQGIPVDKKGKVTRNKKGKIAKTSKTKHTVYNMFGYGAKDSCPIECGAQYAFDHGWFTIEESIFGGIKSIHSYIARGQDTLYKMRWNPDGGLTPPAIPEWYQYATHTEWAVIQTRRIADIYKMMDEYVVEMDVPYFHNTPSTGKTTAKSLEMKSGPSNSKNSIGKIPKNATVKIVGSNPKAWYKVTYKGKTGWVRAKYVKMKY